MESFQPGQSNYPRGDVPGFSVNKFRQLVDAYQMSSQVGFAYLCLIGVNVGFRVIPDETGFLVLGLSLVGIGVFLFFAIRAARASAIALDKNVTVAIVGTIVLTCVPCGALILIASMQGRVGKALREFGLKPGVFGLDKSKVAEIEARLANFSMTTPPVSF